MTGPAGPEEGADDDQREVVRFLSDPANWPAAPDRVDTLETHGARVFLAGDRALKVKRAVRYDYMDFSTLAKRRAVLEKELHINRPHAPAIYQGLTAITRTPDGGLALDGTGPAVEWALVMTRFDQHSLLSAIAVRGGLDRALAHRTADAVAAYHASAEPVTDGRGAARIAATLDHLAACGLPDATLFPRADIAAWAAAARAHLARNTRLLDDRARAGAVRRAHGDLHLANIVVLDSAPVLFDAIEFDDEIRTVDCLYDLAFLLMDLDAKGCTAPANWVLDRYLARPGGDADIEGLAALPLFLSLRAAIRAMTARQRAALGRPETRDAARSEALAYFARARAYLSPSAPRLIAVGGLSGTGKSTLARALAPGIPPVPGALVVRSDVERKRLFGATETERLPPETYTSEASDKVYAALLAKAARVLAAGHSVILDAVFANGTERDRAAAVARAAACPFTGLWLEAPPETLRARVAARTGDASDATVAVVDAQLAASPTAGTWTPVRAGRDPAQTLTDARKALGLAAPDDKP